MVFKLFNFTHKSFKNYTTPEDLHFRPKNIVFGYNGNGKSALANGIKEEFLKDTTKKPENIRIFDRDYISNSLLLENTDGKIKGVEASFGKTSVDIENRIKELESQIISQDEINKLEESISKLRKEIRDKIDEIHDKRKGNANIQKKPRNESVERVIELYNNDYQEAKKIEEDDNELIKISGDDTFEKRILQIEHLRPFSFPKIQTNLIEEVEKIFNEKFGDDISIPHYEVVQWIESGLRIHKEGDNCKFCGGQLDYDEINSKFKQYKENKKQKAVEKLKDFEIRLQNILKLIEALENESKIYSANIDKKFEEYFSAISNKKEKIENFIKLCQSKIKNIQGQENFDFQLLSQTLEIIETSISKINEIRNIELSELRDKQNKLAALVKGAIGLEIIKSTLIREKLNEVKNKEEELRAKLDNNQKKRQEILELKQQKSLTKDFADFVSQILKDINISLVVTLDKDNRNYIIKSAHENVILTIKDISEGEKNLLALLFFYYELFADNKQEQIKSEIELIIVDDPISSMDDSNKFYILELMKNLLELQNQQIFIMTHSWDDICNLSYGKKSWENNQPFATFEIRKVDGKSELFKLKNIEKPYKYLFREIYEFSQKREDDIKTDCQIYHYPNVMRRVFEEWYSFKIGKDLNLTSSQQDRITNELKITDNGEKMKLGILLKVCNILSHSINNSKNPQEIHQSAKYLMKLIENNDKLHYNNMKR